MTFRRAILFCANWLSFRSRSDIIVLSASIKLGRLKPADGVVRYTSAHLDGTASELVVRSGHGVANNADAQAEVERILRLELQAQR